MSKVKDLILGLAVGDALGVPVEFIDRETLKGKPVDDMWEYLTHNQPKGTWSDDTSMTLCTLDSFCNGFDIKDIANKFVKWQSEQLYTPHGDVFDIGVSTYWAIDRIKQGYKITGGIEESSNGNGSLMRIAPLVFLGERMNGPDRLNAVIELSSITHAHPISILSCCFYIMYLDNLIYNDACKYVAYEKAREEFKTILALGICLDHAIHFERFINLSCLEFKNLTEDEIFSSGYVVHTLEASIWCILNTDNYKDAVLKAVNLGEDTDTTGAVTGALAGIIYGYSAIPSEWLDVLVKRDMIESLCDKFQKTREL